jgi:hypothetical protein
MLLTVASHLRALALQVEDKISTTGLKTLFVDKGLIGLLKEAPVEIQTVTSKIADVPSLKRKDLEAFHDTVKSRLKEIPATDPTRDLYQVLVLQPIQHALGRIQFLDYSKWNEYKDALEQYTRSKNQAIKERKKLLIELLSKGVSHQQVGEPEGHKVLRTTSVSAFSTEQTL